MTTPTVGPTSVNTTTPTTTQDFHAALDHARTSQAAAQTPIDPGLMSMFVTDFAAVMEPLMLNQLNDILGDAFSGGDL